MNRMYGGTKTEMERLIKDASNLTDVQKELGITVDANDMSFGNIVNAISVMQTQMGIAGTTTKEAEETISGSINQMSASWSNLITGMADDNADFDGLINGFVKSFSAVLKNIIPRIKTTVKGIGQVINGLLKEMDKLLDDEMIDIIAEALTDIIKTISTGLPKMLKAGGEIIKTLAQGIIQMIPEMTKSLTEVIGGIVSGITELLPTIVQAGADILVNLINGITEQIPQLAPKMVEVISSIVSTLTENLPTIISAGVTLLTSLAIGIVNAIPDLVAKIPELITGIVTALTSEDAISSIITGAVNLFMGIVEAIPQAVVKIGEAMPQIITAIVGGLIAGVGNIISTAVEIFTGIKDGAKDSEQALRDEIGAISDFGDALNNTKPMLNDYNQLISDQGNTIGDLDRKTQEVEDAITEILKTAIADQKGLRDEDLQNIRDYMDKLNELQEEKLSIYRDQQLSELRKLQLESGIITQETAQQHLANTQEALNKVNQATEDAYTNRLTYIENKYKAMGEVGSDAYNKELADAKTWYDQSLKENQKYYDDAVKVVQDKSKEWVKADKDKWEEMDRYTDAFNKDNKSWLDKTIANFEDFVGANKGHLKNLTDAWGQMDLDGAQAFLELVGMMHKSGADIDDETKDMVKAILGNFEDLPDSMQDVGGDTLQGLIGGMEDYIPELGDMSDMTADEIVDTIKKVLGIASPSKVMKELGKNTTQGLIEGMKSEESNLKTAGKNLADGVQKGFLGQESQLKSKVLGMMSRVTGAVRKEMKINSPSKVYAQIGDYMAQGIGVGFTDEMADVTKDINKSIPTSLDGVSGSNSNGINMVGAFKQALSEMKVVLDDAEVGTFIDKTVAQLVYAQ